MTGPSPSPLSSPPPAHPPSHPHHSITPSGEDDREDTELHTIAAPRESNVSTAADTDRSIPRYALHRQEQPRWWDGVRRFWGRHVSITVPSEGRRDHLALERTYLGYLRTSLALSMTAVIIAQLFRLEHGAHRDGYYALGVPLAAVFTGAAIAVALLGAVRFWRQQGAMVRGKVIASGWEVLVVMVGALGLCIALFALVVGVDARKEL